MIISLENVFKYYGADCILRNVCATINDKDRIGLVGANGEGKTTLLNVLTGELDYEEGTVSLTNGKVIGYLHQNSGLSNGRTIQQEMEAVFADLLALGEEVDALQRQMAQVHDDPTEYEKVSAEYQKKLARFEAADGYQVQVKIDQAFAGLLFPFGSYDGSLCLCRGLLALSADVRRLVECDDGFSGADGIFPLVPVCAFSDRRFVRSAVRIAGKLDGSSSDRIAVCPKIKIKNDKIR